MTVDWSWFAIGALVGFIALGIVVLVVNYVTDDKGEM